ncbi:hypothetical protein [Paenibacillus elgii]|uniref:hypothetical protein n=1 Tax=Paenibacillus elgii TaxID=189691 RepID=UPI0013D4FEF6|nr:hypothetical protein [Paenibacillus elgii]
MKPAPLETEEDLQLVKEFILLPLLLDVLERDISALETTPLKMFIIYTKKLRHIQDQITADLVPIRTKLRERGIKIYEQKRTKMRIEACYLCRGYHRHFSMLWGLVKAELHVKLSMYLDIDVRSSSHES